MRNIELKARLHDLDAARAIAIALSCGISRRPEFISALGDATIDFAHSTTLQAGINSGLLLDQTDTYFRCYFGRLKLREILVGSALAEPVAHGSEGHPVAAQLIAYQRADLAESKASDYTLVDVLQPELLKAQLAGSLGILTIVQKTREVYLHQNVRIHLDQVAGLGSFIEFEAVLQPGDDDCHGHQQLAELQKEFGILPNDLESRSYSDMLMEVTET